LSFRSEAEESAFCSSDNGTHLYGNGSSYYCRVKNDCHSERSEESPHSARAAKFYTIIEAALNLYESSLCERLSSSSGCSLSGQGRILAEQIAALTNKDLGH